MDTQPDATLTASQEIIRSASVDINDLMQQRRQIEIDLANAKAEQKSLKDKVNATNSEKNTQEQAYEKIQQKALEGANRHDAARPTKQDVEDKLQELRETKKLLSQLNSQLLVADGEVEQQETALAEVGGKLKAKFSSVEQSIALLIKDTRDEALKYLLSEDGASDTRFDFAYENNFGLRHYEVQPGSVHHKGPPEMCVGFSSISLQEALQGLVDHLSDRRIAEELDTVSYLRSLRAALDRASRKSSRLRNKQILAAVEDAEEKSRALKSKFDGISSDLETFEWDSFRESKLGLQSSLGDTKSELDKKFTRFSELHRSGAKRLEMLERHVLSLENYENLAKTSGIISDEISKQSFIRFWPFAVGVIFAALMYATIGYLGFAHFIFYSKSIIIASFTLAYLTSVWLGRRYRRTIMSRVRKEFVSAIGKYTPLAKNDRSGLQFALIKHTDFLKQPTGNGRMKNPENIRRKAKASLIFRNVGFLAAQAIVLFVASNISDGVTHRFIRIDPMGRYCLAATGRLVYSDHKHFLIKTNTSDGTNPLSAKNYQLLSTTDIRVLTQADIASDTSEISTGQGNVLQCETSTPPSASIEYSKQIDQAKVEIINKIASKPETAQVVATGVLNISDQLSHQQKTIDRLGEQSGSQAKVLERIVELMKDVSKNAKGTVFVAEQFFFPHSVENEAHSTVGINEMSAKKIVLPFFRVPINATENEEQKAYEIGKGSWLDFRVLGTPENESMSFLERLASALEPFSTDGKKAFVEIDVMGFASEVWKNPPNGEDISAEGLNHALAEGRRAAIIKALQDLTAGYSASVSLVQSGPTGKSTICLSDWLDGPQWKSAVRFKDYDDMRANLSTLLPKVPGNDSLEEFWARSAIISLDVVDQPCGSS